MPRPRSYNAEAVPLALAGERHVHGLEGETPAIELKIAMRGGRRGVSPIPQGLKVDVADRRTAEVPYHAPMPSAVIGKNCRIFYAAVLAEQQNLIASVAIDVGKHRIAAVFGREEAFRHPEIGALPALAGEGFRQAPPLRVHRHVGHDIGN